jgi:hypothetical protein
VGNLSTGAQIDDFDLWTTLVAFISQSRISVGISQAFIAKVLGA